MMLVQVISYLLVAFLLLGFTVLAGYDLGISALMLLARRNSERRSMLAAIGPFWDGNEVWLIGLGGMLFAAYPPVYAALFSGLYVAFIVLLLALIIRAVSIDFGAKSSTAPGQAYWSYAVGVSGLLVILLLGVTMGNLLLGMPLDAQGQITGSRWFILNGFALVIGLLNLAMLATHGITYLGWKTGAGLEQFTARIRRWTAWAWSSYLLLLVITFSLAGLFAPHLLRNFDARPWLWVVPVGAIILVTLTGLQSIQGRYRRAFIMSSGAIALVLTTVVIALYPLLLPARGDLTQSLSGANTSSSPLTLLIMNIVLILGLPVILAYTAWVHYLFGGPVTSESQY